MEWKVLQLQERVKLFPASKSSVSLEIDLNGRPYANSIVRRFNSTMFGGSTVDEDNSKSKNKLIQLAKKALLFTIHFPLFFYLAFSLHLILLNYISRQQTNKFQAQIADKDKENGYSEANTNHKYKFLVGKIFLWFPLYVRWSIFFFFIPRCCRFFSFFFIVYLFYSLLRCHQHITGRQQNNCSCWCVLYQCEYKKRNNKNIRKSKKKKSKGIRFW